MSWHRHKRRWEAGLANLFDIPQDVALDLPRITMLGNTQLLVENHKGIVEYTPERVRLKLTLGELEIGGTAMTLSNLRAEQMLVEGTISWVKYIV